ncbi:DNA-directed RNA polymerase subunit omega [Alloacidobacterium dinghuense]|uniref:DNA-directed RNA polymerase subunit omega n=1 Tax=Alloacidobacterium dinghuense TaxID=2763107 RepID=A0A7G8BCA8_9BACT|nr:DNA-directed RNA polymerase subunit omega [Alloacidobacterium dinghuense]QNI30178.1 DNA-directed RNA polymerase subunit omega [Alloacidobacterium dinghuense]
MRSELVFGAMAHISNQFLLTKLAAKATRKLHRPNTRIQETMNAVLVRFSRANPVAGEQPATRLQVVSSVAEVPSNGTHLKQSVA